MHRPSRAALMFLSRFYWMSLGPVALFFLMILIVDTGSGWFTLYDLIYGLALLGIVVCRWLEFRCGRPRTFDGARARAAQLRQYVVAVMVLGTISWVAANVMGNHVSPSRPISARAH